MKLLFSLIIALGFVVCIILAAEGICSTWQMILGLLVFFPLSFVAAQWRHPITIFPIAILTMLILYFGIKHAWLGLIPGGILGVSITLLLSVGWINPHKPFSREKYVQEMTKKAGEE